LAALTTPILEKGIASEGGFDRFRRALNLISRDNIVALATAGLIDLTSKLAPVLKKTAESLLSVLSTSANLASGHAAAERIIKTGNDDILAAFIGLLQAVSSEGFSGVILLDQIQLASQAVLDAAIAVARNLPDNWAFCATVNDELPEGQTALQVIRPPFLYRGGQILTVPGLDLTALEVWTQAVRGKVPSMTELGGVLESCDGRPLFLQDWVRGLTSTPEIAVHNRLDAYYEERLRRLSPDSRRLLRMLSVLPAYTYFSFDFCHALLAADNPSRSADSTIDVIAELQDKYFLESQPGADDGYRLIHEVTREHIFRRLPRTAARKAAETILSVIDTHLRDSGSAAQLGYLMLADLADRSDLIYRDAMPIASMLLASGAYESARAAYTLCVKSAQLQVTSAQDEFKAKAALRENS
jgi:hypothetical protein